MAVYDAQAQGAVLTRPNPMPVTFSLYLDGVRFMAAIAVFLEHFTAYPFTDTSPGREGVARLLGSYGSVAVTIFFVLSGFVIAHVVAMRERTAGAYALSRFSRLYSVVLPALVLTFVLDALGQWLHPDFYSIQKVMFRPPSIASYGSSLFFLNEWQVFHWRVIVPGTNGPYWSLSFEATYYLLAGLMLFARREISVVVCIVTLALAGRTVTAMLPIWALGFWLYHTSASIASKVRAPTILFLLSGVTLLLLPFLLGRLHFDNFGVRFEWGRARLNRDLLIDYAAASAFALNLVTALRLLADHRQPGKYAVKSIRWLGAVTFPLYAMHFPALCFFAAINPFNRKSALGMAFLLASVSLLIAAVTPLCDALKLGLRRRPFLTATPAGGIVS